MNKVIKNDELREIINTLKPMESVWCNCLHSEIVMFHTGYSVTLYNSETTCGINDIRDIRKQ